MFHRWSVITSRDWKFNVKIELNSVQLAQVIIDLFSMNLEQKLINCTSIEMLLTNSFLVYLLVHDQLRNSTIAVKLCYVLTGCIIISLLDILYQRWIPTKYLKCCKGLLIVSIKYVTSSLHVLEGNVLKMLRINHHNSYKRFQQFNVERNYSFNICLFYRSTWNQSGYDLIC